MPIRSLRAKRKAAVLWLAAMTIGLLAIALDGSVTARILSPGPVTLQHSQVGGCAGCHLDFDQGPSSWIHAALRPDDGLTESKKCLSCHGWEEHAFAPHSLNPKALERPVSETSETSGRVVTPVDLKLARLLFRAPDEVSDSFACGTCHKEHRGADSDLTLMSNGQCQSCHNVRFASLADGHPGFGDYPYSRRTRINFDHWSHIERHFEKAGSEKSPDTCTDCHSPSDDGELMLVRSFDKACAACHLDQIEGEGQSGAKGIVFLTVPGLDVELLRQEGVEIGEWPELSEEKITPFLKLLLMDIEGLEADLRRAGSLDLLDLTDATAEDLSAVGNVVWAVKRLIRDFLILGMVPIGERITANLGQDVNRSQLGHLLGAVPLNVIRSAQETWFPNLFREIALREAGLPVTEPLDPNQSDDAPALEESRGADQQEIPADDDEILSDDKENLKDDDILSDDEAILADDDDILSDDGGGRMEPDPESGKPNGNPDSASFGEAVLELDAEAWAGHGGWYRFDFALYFKPTGHADPFMRTWLDLSGRGAVTSPTAIGGRLFETLSHKNGPGRCTKCHSVDQMANSGFLVNWRAKQKDLEFRLPTYFSHSTHFSLLDQEGCKTCHKFEQGANYAVSFEQRDPEKFASNFRPLEKATCAQCHVEDQAGDGCLGCHRYHIGHFPGPVVQTIMGSKNSSAAADGEVGR